ncbi:MAG: fused DSP-PTPase phosphatase/NAD kinase-like protein [Thalassovita sp.]
MRIVKWFYHKDPELRAQVENIPDTPEGAKLARFYMRWIDHEVLRHVWTNLYEVAPGVWRGNHPTPKRWHWLHDQGIRTVLNFRGASGKPHYVSERKICAELGMNVIDVPGMGARLAPGKAPLLQMIQVFRTAERPLFMHCKSGADRTSLASAIYLLVIEGKPMSEARKMMSRRFIHFKSTRSGVLDAVLDAYEHHGGDFETWVRDHYDPAKVQAAFDKAYAARKGHKA